MEDLRRSVVLCSSEIDSSDLKKLITDMKSDTGSQTVHRHPGDENTGGFPSNAHLKAKKYINLWLSFVKLPSSKPADNGAMTIKLSERSAKCIV